MRRRRGRDTGTPDLLLERAAECAVIAERLEEARAGAGGVIVIEGPAGQGKSRLVKLAGDTARELDFQLLGAYGSELELHFPFGIAIQLFEPWWLGATEEERTVALQDPDGAVAHLLRRGPGRSESDGGFATIHGLFRLTARLASAAARGTGEPRPLAMLVDDAHWADGPSLRFLAYLAGRISDLPVTLVIALRQGDPTPDAQAIVALRTAAAEAVLRPRSLSPDAVAELARAAFPAADDSFCAAAGRVTNGNPFLLHELLEQLRRDGRTPDAATAAGLEGLAPEAVLDAVVARVGSMPDALSRVARAVAVLGDGAPLRRVARLAGLEIADAARAADALAEMHLLFTGEPLTFVHPLIRHALQQSMSPLDQAQAHLTAARLLGEEGAPDEAVAPHLLSAPAHGDVRTVAVLRGAGAKALASGDAPGAIEMLRRALAEGHAESRAEVLAELADAEAGAGRPEATARLQEAIRAASDPGRRAHLSLALGTALYRAGEYPDAVDAFDAGLAELPDRADPVAQDLTAARVAAAALASGRVEVADHAAEQLLADLPAELRPHQRAALAHLAWLRAARGAARPAVQELADRAWDGGRLLDGDIAPHASWPLLGGALLIVDDLEQQLALCDAALAWAGDRQSAAEMALAQHVRGWALYERAELDAAAAAAEAAVDGLPPSRPIDIRTAYGLIARCRIQQRRLDDAEEALAVIDHPGLRTEEQLPSLLTARAALRLEQRRPADALGDAVRAGHLWETRLGEAAPGALPWRSTAALAHLALGQEAEARRLAAEELALAEGAGAGRIVMRNLRILGQIEGGEAGLARLAHAARIGADHPLRLEYVAVLVALGGALRRANQRAAARDPLRRALELSRRGGLTALAQRADHELRATGARIRTASRWGPDALTPSERRVAELAIDGLTTREIAETLFVTPKTVEYHLRHIYQKLGVNSRDRLSGALNADD